MKLAKGVKSPLFPTLKILMKQNSQCLKSMLRSINNNTSNLLSGKRLSGLNIRLANAENSFVSDFKIVDYFF